MISVNGVTVDQGHFPDGTLAMKLWDRLSESRIDIKWQYENDSELFTLACIRKHFGNCPADLYMLYIPHARMDRVEKEGDVFTLKYFCDAINDLNFHKVYVLDPHSNVSVALLNNVQIIDVDNYLFITKRIFTEKYDKSNCALFYPDAGAMKRYTKKNDLPFAFGMKDRDWATGEIRGLTIMNEESIVGKDVLIIDDICSRGGTFYYAAKALKEAGAKSVSLYVTHCENTILKGEVFKSGLIEEVYTTTSLIHCDELKKKLTYIA